MRSAAVPIAIALLASRSLPAPAQVVARGQPSVSPDGRQIAYVESRGAHSRLWLMNADGTGAHELRLPDTDGRAPRFSATGELLFSGDGGDSGTVLAWRNDSAPPRIIARMPGRSPTLSPDGRHVLYLSGPWTSTALMVSDVDGSNVRRLAGGRATAWNGAWSPDGQRVAFAYGDSTRRLQVHVVELDGQRDRAITHTTADEGSAQLPAWSPDGQRIAMQVNNLPTHTSAIWIVELPTGAVRRAVAPASPHLDETPSWFPDGARIAIQSNRSGNMEVWVMQADGSDARQLTGRAEP